MLVKIEHEDGRGSWRRESGLGIGREAGGMGVGPDQPEHAIDLILVSADQQCRIAAAQEATSAGETCGAKILIEQGIDHVIGIVVLDNGYDEFLHACSPPT
jgi:hypothetical protein